MVNDFDHGTKPKKAVLPNALCERLSDFKETNLSITVVPLLSLLDLIKTRSAAFSFAKLRSIDPTKSVSWTLQ
eukprot:CAMPEP_0194695208 /NCGR_PEP_ID=MMETSP0295-20121207/21803_1 /TAXON_ID=39354 /ORGANISM="Heterosigma akashiwo, Strain CCMP2393" /LENGTH=72 /DNA_ID=CAMNT_0039586863 /DNA_START=466 /DNA_END=684 /DNA_ORIENTATION=-